MRKLAGYMMMLGICGALAAGVDNPTARYIQRSMKAMAESTAERPATLRVFFYGQSIVAQNWTQTIEKQLKETYPTVRFEFCKRAIGGFTSEALIRTAEHDLYSWNPDLLFFHVYGSLKQYEGIVRKTRETTAAEIILWSSHLSRNQDPKAMAAKRDDRSLGIQDIAKRYHCMYIDLNKKWCDMLNAEGKPAGDYLTDGIHLNPEGCRRYAAFIGEELLRRPELGDGDAASGTIRTVPASAFVAQPDGSHELTFEGTRVVAISNGQGQANAQATVLLDGKPLAGQKELWALTRTSTGPYIWMPAIKCVSFRETPVAEDWKLVCLPDSTPDGKKLHFKVIGSVTGEDGEGWSTEAFVSKSGRVAIEARDWHVAWPILYRNQNITRRNQEKNENTPPAYLPKDFTVTWKSYPTFTDRYAPAPAGARTLLIQGSSPRQRHTLTLQGASPQQLGIESLQINCPN